MNTTSASALAPAPVPLDLALNLTPDLKALVRQSVAPSTFEAYSKAWVRLGAWLNQQSLSVDDLSDGVLAEYVSALFSEGLAPASIRILVAGPKFILRLAGRDGVAGPLTQRAMAGVSRAGRDRGRGQSAGVSWKESDRIARKLKEKPNAHAPSASLRDGAAVRLASDCLLRVSELLAVQVGDLSFDEDGGGVLSVRSSKTDQTGRGAELFFGGETADALRSWLWALGNAVGSRSLKELFGLPPSQHVFTRVWRGDTVTADPLSHRRLREILKSHMGAFLPDDGRRRSSHAFRIGSAQSLARAGGSLVDLQTAGRWVDPSMPARYCKGEMARRGAVARLRYGRK